MKYFFYTNQSLILYIIKKCKLLDILNFYHNRINRSKVLVNQKYHINGIKFFNKAERFLNIRK